MHHAAEIPAGFLGKQVAMECLACKRARNGAIRADQPQIEAQLLHNWQRKGVAPPGDHDHLDPSLTRMTQRSEIDLGNLKLGI